MKPLKLGLPYMGSKRAISSKLVDFMLEENPNAKYVYDLFGGGGAMTFEFASRPQIEKIVYNELNTAIVELLKDIRENGVTDKYYQWIDRETFNKHKYDNDWFGGLVSCVWSFGNNQKNYLFSPENEKLKRPLHLAIVTQDEKYLKEFEELTGVKIPVDALENEDLHKRRLNITSYLRRNYKKTYCQELGRLHQLKLLFFNYKIEYSNKSYEEVIIDTPIDETIIYLDPPYVNTAKYKEDLNHAVFLEWVKKSKYKIYMSSYESELPEVFSIEKRVLISSKDKTLRAQEKLFTNRIEEIDEESKKRQFIDSFLSPR